MKGIISIYDSIYSIATNYPECIDILYQLGFKEIKKASMIQTVGRYVHLQKGCTLRKIPIQLVAKTLEKHGYQVLMEEKQ